MKIRFWFGIVIAFAIVIGGQLIIIGLNHGKDITTGSAIVSVAIFAIFGGIFCGWEKFYRRFLSPQ